MPRARTRSPWIALGALALAGPILSAHGCRARETGPPPPARPARQDAADAPAPRWVFPGDVHSPARDEVYERQMFTAADGTELPYWLLVPAEIAADRTYPLVLALHGRGGNTEAGRVLAGDELRANHPCFVLAPAVPAPVIWSAPEGAPDAAAPEALPVVLELLTWFESRHPIDPGRIYVTGQSMGGMGAFGAVALAPGTFAAAIAVCGGWEPGQAREIASVPIWVFHGAADEAVPPERSREMVQALEQAGGTVRYTEFPGVGHFSWGKAYGSRETWEWLFAQQRTR